MDGRMRGIGQNVIRPRDINSLQIPTHPLQKPSDTQHQYKPPYSYYNYPNSPPPYQVPQFFYSPLHQYQKRQRMYNSKVKDRISDLKMQLDRSEHRDMRRRFLQKVNSIVGMVPKASPVSKPETPVNKKTDDTLMDMMNHLQQQQRNLARVVNSLQDLHSTARPYNFPQYSPEYSMPLVSPQQTFIESQRESRISRSKEPDIKVSQADLRSSVPDLRSSIPDMTPQEIYREFDINDDSEDQYLDEEKKYKFEPGMSDFDKMQLAEKFKKDRFGKQIDIKRQEMRGIQLFRAGVYTVLFQIFLFHEMIRRKTKYKAEYIKNMQESIDIFNQVAKTWVLKAIRIPLISVLNDPNLDLDIFPKGYWFSKKKITAFNSKILKLKVRLKGIIDSLHEFTTDKEIPAQLRLFLARYIRNGVFLPQNYLTSFEKSRLYFDQHGAIQNQTSESKRMMIAFFFITRIIIGKYFLKPAKEFLPVHTNPKSMMNLQILGGFLQHMVLMQFIGVSRSSSDKIADQNLVVQRNSGQNLGAINDDEVSQFLPTFKELENSLKELGDFVDELSASMSSWTENMIRVCEHTLNSL